MSIRNELKGFFCLILKVTIIALLLGQIQTKVYAGMVNDTENPKNWEKEIYDECECTPLLKENGTKLYGIADRDYLEGELFHVKFLGTHVDDKGNITFYRSFSTTTKLCTVEFGLYNNTNVRIYDGNDRLIFLNNTIRSCSSSTGTWRSYFIRYENANIRLVEGSTTVLNNVEILLDWYDHKKQIHDYKNSIRYQMILASSKNNNVQIASPCHKIKEVFIENSKVDMALQKKLNNISECDGTRSGQRFLCRHRVIDEELKCNNSLAHPVSVNRAVASAGINKICYLVVYFLAKTFKGLY